MVWKLARCKITIRSGPSDLCRFQSLISAPSQGFGDHDLESRDASSPDSRNENSRKELFA
jgi:hypothetical protein